MKVSIDQIKDSCNHKKNDVVLVSDGNGHTKWSYTSNADSLIGNTIGSFTVYL